MRGIYACYLARQARRSAERQKPWMIGVGKAKYAKSCLVHSVYGGPLQDTRNTAIRNKTVVRQRTMRSPHHSRAAHDVSLDHVRDIHKCAGHAELFVKLPGRASSENGKRLWERGDGKSPARRVSEQNWTGKFSSEVTE